MPFFPPDLTILIFGEGSVVWNSQNIFHPRVILIAGVGTGKKSRHCSDVMLF
jgi:hypothetical protein